jgi:hypothetical protein
MRFRPNHSRSSGRLFGLLALLTLALTLMAPGSARAADTPGQAVWYKGVVHAHANWGVPQLPTTAPDVVVRWYREHNYNFVSVSDLNYYTPPEGLKALFDAPGRFLVRLKSVSTRSFRGSPPGSKLSSDARPTGG